MTRSSQAFLSGLVLGGGLCAFAAAYGTLVLLQEHELRRGRQFTTALIRAQSAERALTVCQAWNPPRRPR